MYTSAKISEIRSPTLLTNMEILKLNGHVLFVVVVMSYFDSFVVDFYAPKGTLGGI